MQIHKMIKDMIIQHKTKIELIQWAITSSIGSLFYAEFLTKIRQKQTPTRKILVPPVKSIRDMIEGEFSDFISDKLIDEINKMLNLPRYKDFRDAPELILFNEDNIEVMKTIFDLYMLENIKSRIPETIEKKFRIGDSKQQLIYESNEIDMFDRKPPTDTKTLEYLAEESILQMLTLMPTMKKEVELPESNKDFLISQSEVLTIGHDNGICPIHLNKNIISKCDAIVDKLLFITNTKLDKASRGNKSMMKDDELVIYKASSGMFNQIAITRFIGIQNIE